MDDGFPFAHVSFIWLIVLCIFHFSLMYFTYSSRIRANKALVINGHSMDVDNHFLSIISPVFAAMFESDMKEKCEEEIKIKDVESSEHFAEFLRALSPNERCLPNR